MAHRTHQILLVESQPAATLGLKAIISTRNDAYEIRAICGSADEGLDYLREHHGDIEIVLTAYLFPHDGDGIDFAHRIAENWPELRVILLSAIEDESVALRAIRNGVSGVVGRSDRHTVILGALEAAADHKRFISPSFQGGVGLVGEALSERQRAVLQMMTEGMRTAEIASSLGVGEETVRTHIKAAIRKLGATDRTQAVAIALRHGLID